MHMAHGSPSVSSVLPRIAALPCSARQRRIATISPCAVGSSFVRPRLRPRAMTWPSRTITAPNGKSACFASSIAMRMKRSSSGVPPRRDRRGGRGQECDAADPGKDAAATGTRGMIVLAGHGRPLSDIIRAAQVSVETANFV